MQHFRTFATAIALAAMTTTGAVAETKKPSDFCEENAGFCALATPVILSVIGWALLTGGNSPSKDGKCDRSTIGTLPDGTRGPTDPDCW